MWTTLIQWILFIALKIIKAFCFVISFSYYFDEPKRCPPIKDDILLLPARSLAEKIRNKDITSKSVIQSYISRIKAVNPIINAVVEDRFDSAITEAISVDKMISDTVMTGKELSRKYPLLGVPITVKECIAVKGSSHGAGKYFPSGVKRASTDADVVVALRKAGAIPILVSNTPLMCLHFETFNNVTGRTCNPYDTRRTCGASSGGEGALLGSAASVIGIGSDIHGSVRLPAHYCGVWGHKPSANIVSLEGHYPGSKDRALWNDLLTLGPMSRYAVDLPILLNVMVKDTIRGSLKLNEEVDIKKIKFYYMLDNGGSILTTKVSKDIKNAIKKVVTHMNSEYGCHKEELNIKEFKYSGVSWLKMSSLAEVDVISDITYWDLVEYVTGRSDFSLFPLISALLIKWSVILPKSVTRECSDYINAIKKKLSNVLGTNGVLIYPALPTAAHIHKQGFHKIFDSSYMGIFNSMGFPATCCPVGLNSEGLPIGIQVVGACNNDKLTLAVAQEIENIFGGWVPPPTQKSNQLT